MGMPASWSILSIFHYLCLKAAGIIHFGIRGDDAIFSCSMRRYQRYLDLVKEVGFEINFKKTFASPTHGTFCEEFYVREGPFLVKVPTISFRVFNPDQVSLSSIEASLNCGAYTPERRHAIAVLGAPYLLRLAKRYRVNPFLPTYYGGLGFPPKSSVSRCSKKSEAKVRTIDTQGFNVPVLAAISGPNSQRITRGLNLVRFSTCSDCRCTHLDRLRSEMSISAFIQDLKEGRAVRRSFSLSRQLRAQARAWARVAPSYDSKMSGRTYLSMYGRDVWPIASDLQKVFGHLPGVCKRLDMRKDSPPRLSWGPTFFANF